MDYRKQILMVLPVMKGGGAERVAALLMNQLYNQNYDVKVFLTSSGEQEIVRRDLNSDIPIEVMPAYPDENRKNNVLRNKMFRIYASVICRGFEAFGLAVPGYFAYCSFISQYKNEIQELRSIMQKNPKMTVIAFLQPSIPIVVLAAQGLPNKIIISERGNPKRVMKHRYGRNFISKYYTDVNHVVFQTEEAKGTYPWTISVKGRIIYNPIKSNLPNPHFGKRKKCITTFCRISVQKNLLMLIEAFFMLHTEHPEYILKIIGDANNEEGIQVKISAEKLIKSYDLQESVQWHPFNADVHRTIVEDAMYVNSSDYEGMSNAMLEAMAIGMPVVCTDCPIGGAHAVIEDGINGLLVPVGDVKAMYKAMKRIVEEEEFAVSLSHNAVKIRDSLSLENIASQWMELIDE